MRASRASFPTILLLALSFDAEASIAPQTDDVIVSTYTSGFRANPSIAATTDGQFIVVWQDSRPDIDGTHVFGRKLDQDAALVGTEFQIDGAGSALARGPSIVASGDGQFTVVWRSDPNDGERARLLAQRIGTDGSPVGTEFQVNTPRTLDGYYYLSDPAAARAGTEFGDGFVVVWASGIDGRDLDRFGPDSEVFERRFFPDAQPLGADDVVSVPGGEDSVRAEIAPDVARLPDGTFVVAWAQGYFSGFDSNFQTVGRRLFQSGQPSGTEFAVGTGGASGPRVAARDPAGFSVMWSTFAFVDYIPAFGGDLVARTFDAAARPIAERFVVSTPASGLDPLGDPLRPFAGVNGVAGASSTTGEFVVAWASGKSYDRQYYGGSSDGDGSGIFGRPLLRDDTPSGREHQVNAAGAGDQKHPEIAFGDSDTLAVVWDADDGADDDHASDRIFARVFDLIAPACGDGDEDGTSDATDALFTLQAAVGARSCSACLCDVNSSNALTAADALIVLRVAVGAGSTLTCPACAPASVKFALQSDATCWGAHVEVSAEAVPSGGAGACTADPALALLGCTSSFTSEAGALTFDARGCFLDPAELFACTFSQSQAAALAQASSTACGCGCADTCPSTPVLCAAIDGGPACATPPALVSKAPQRLRAGTAPSAETTSVQETVTSSTTCETCCDFSDNAGLVLSSDESLTELAIRFHAVRDPSCAEDITCSFDTAIGGPAYARFTDEENTVEVCFSDNEGIDGPLTFGQCSSFANVIMEGPAEVVRAVGTDLKPIALPPSVNVQ